jgi:carbamoyl-phosphate synthase/aspartate carbamoyltransferase/dihydroorotase
MTLLRIPGMLDPHVHLRDLEWAHKATFASETTAALAGGYWAVLDMPNTPPPTINRVNLERKLERIGSAAACDWGVYVGASQDENQSEYPAVFDRVCGLKIYNNATTGTLLVDNQSARARHYEAWPLGKRIAVHAEGQTVTDILEMVQHYRKPTHFCHISTAEEMLYLRAAKAEGLPISIGVTPHHLFLTEADVKTLGPLGLMKPELKTQADQDALWAGIADGVIDVVESDHAPHTLEEKFSDRPPYGVPGLETTLPLLCMAVRQGWLTIERAVELVATTPRRLFGLPCPDETYTLVDTDAEFEIRRGDLRTAPAWSPFEGMRVCGRVRGVWIRGQQVYDGENVLVEPGFGQNVAGIQQAVGA